MNRVTPEIVRKHFVFVQKSKEVSPSSFDDLKECISHFNDCDIKDMIKEPSNQLFNMDATLWVYEELQIRDVYCLYDNLQEIKLPEKCMNYLQITEYLKDKIKNGDEHRTLDKIKQGDILIISKVLPIFVVRKQNRYYVQDGQSRITTLCFHGASVIPAYVLYSDGKN